MALRPFTELEGVGLDLPIGGKVYRAFGPSIVDAGKLRALYAGDEAELAKADAHELARLALGRLFDEFVADGVSDAAMMRATLTVITHLLYGPELARIAWETGISGKAITAYMASTAEAAVEPAPEQAADV